MNVTPEQLKANYKSCSYDKLCSLYKDGGLTDVARKILKEVLEERKEKAVSKNDLKIKSVLIRVIDALEMKYTPEELEGYLSLIYKRYKRALANLGQDDEKKHLSHLKGSVQAYLQIESDYNSLLVKNMDEAEMLIIRWGFSYKGR